MKRNFPQFECSINRQVLSFRGWLEPDDCKDRYKVLIEYVAGNEPRSTVLYPKIEPSVMIHMYENRSLCLHYAPDMRWDEKTKICEYTVPWISEWIVYYELYLMNGGKWEGKESPAHLKETDMNVNQDMD